jgi:hypothetical protein
MKSVGREGRNMTIALLITAGALLSIGTLYVFAMQTVTHPALASENTAIGLHDASDTLINSGSPMQARADWQLTTVDDLTDAEDLLDSLEAHGHVDRELVVLGNSCFAVRWR